MRIVLLVLLVPFIALAYLLCALVDLLLIGVYLWMAFDGGEGGSNADSWCFPCLRMLTRKIKSIKQS